MKNNYLIAIMVLFLYGCANFSSNESTNRSEIRALIENPKQFPELLLSGIKGDVTILRM